MSRYTNLVRIPCPNLTVASRQEIWPPPEHTDIWAPSKTLGLWVKCTTQNTKTPLRVFVNACTTNSAVLVTPVQARSGIMVKWVRDTTEDRPSIVLNCENGDYMVKELALMDYTDMLAAFKLRPFSVWYSDWLQ